MICMNVRSLRLRDVCHMMVGQHSYRRLCREIQNSERTRLCVWVCDEQEKDREKVKVKIV